MMSCLTSRQSCAIAGESNLFKHMVAVTIIVISPRDLLFFSRVFGKAPSVLVLYQFKPIIPQSLSHCPRYESHVYA